ncbi:UbiA family prenyltransferase [Cognatishimia sp. SS12]|uniref:UbiA family prenyltransferase n=1 Tax=Cognatishimia sp. SS12 TaxID=2979465 RepID=UPI00232B5BB8|nr:UbiA family prenyltransferase [Cognatishimia sp. SS12]MDC0737795.1 UbiA family prenyltransferase [Cognatishimia sp. SS12]
MQRDQSKINIPLYVDLDGTLVKTDVAQELLCQVAAKPMHWIGLLQSSKLGRSGVKAFVSERAEFDPANLPYRDDVLDYIRNEKSRGRKVFLATATDARIAKKIFDYIGVFDGVIASDEGNNLKGQAKLEAIQSASPAFEYVGDSKADIPIWNAARISGFVNAPNSAMTSLSQTHAPSLNVHDAVPFAKGLFRAMRPHQWAKNALILLPLFFSHQYGQPDLVARAMLATFMFCLCASAVYIVNDLLDIEADRNHNTKKHRPFASGELRPAAGVGFALVLLLTSLIISSLAFGFALTFLLLLYLFSTSLYSGWLKHKPIFDVIVLTCLYTLRVFIGGVAIGAALSPWLLNFSLFFFASLAFMKRFIEMRKVKAEGKVMARGYLVSDLEAILPMGIATGALSVLTLTLYLNSRFVAETYGAVQILWLIAPLTMFWIFRTWLKALRDEIDDDPVVFALRDTVSRITLVATICVVLTSRFSTLEGLLL